MITANLKPVIHHRVDCEPHIRYGKMNVASICLLTAILMRTVRSQLFCHGSTRGCTRRDWRSGRDPLFWMIGYYAFSLRPEGPWYFRHPPSYTNVIVLQNGTNVTMVQRERPQLLFNETTGEPALLFTGVAPPGAAFYGASLLWLSPLKLVTKAATYEISQGHLGR